MAPLSARRAGAVLTAVGLGLSLVACAAPMVSGEAVAGHRSAQIGPPLTVETVDLRHDYDETHDEVNSYWTEDRISGATPRDPSIDPETPQDPITTPKPTTPTGIVVEPTTGTVAAPVSLTPSDLGDPFPAAGLASSTQGRLYFMIDDSQYVCSASVVSSKNESIVITAGHCVYDNVLGYAQNILFIPADADNGDVAPYGRWTASASYITPLFRDEALVDEDSGSTYGDGWTEDTAFLTMNRNDAGQTIQSVTGGQGLSFGGPIESLVLIGYPSAPPFDGMSQRFCAADAWDYAYWRSNVIETDCVMTQGSSGGGWLTKYDMTAGSGYIVSTTSVGTSTSLGGSLLGENALNLYLQAESS